MTNMIQAAGDQAAWLTQAAYEKAVAAGVLPTGAEVKAAIEIPKDTSHGDYASSFAMAGARALRMAPRAVAQAIVDHLELEGSCFQKVEIAGPGFLNFTLGPRWYGEVLSAIESEGAGYGSGPEGAGKKVMVEFVSANPTDPMNLDGARALVLGDVLANVLSRDGWSVHRELRAGGRGRPAARGFDLVVAIREAGHPEGLPAALEGAPQLAVVPVRPVRLLRDGKPAGISKRTGEAIALHDLLDGISVDAARYYFNNRAPSSPLDFDLDLAVRQDGENPVYYVQYAHARICSLIARMDWEGWGVPDAEQVKPELLDTPEEKTLIKSLAQYPEEIHLAAQYYDPSRINRYLTALAGDFHRFYNACHIRGGEMHQTYARLKLADTVRSVLANGLNLLGVTAPEKM